MNKLAYEIVVLGLGAHFVAARKFTNSETAVRLRVFRHQAGQDFLDLFDRLLDGPRDLLGCQRLVGNVNNRFDHGLLISSGLSEAGDESSTISATNSVGSAK